MITFILSGCYEDKGNYDYCEVNNLDSIYFLPKPTEESEIFSYKYRQPSLDTLVVTYSPVVCQSMEEHDENIEYQWIFSREIEDEVVYDTVFAKELTLKFPPKEKTSYSPLFRAIDHTTGIEYYRNLEMSTIIPFVNSWFVLHGNFGDRKLGVVEGINKEDENINIIGDVYKEIWNRRRFLNANALLYIPHDGRAPAVEHLFVIERDSLSYMHPFDMVVFKKFELLMPKEALPRPRLVYGVSNEEDAGMLMDEDGQLYWTRGCGWLFKVKTDNFTQNYVADKMFMTKSGYVTIWDKVNRQFMYYYILQNRLIRSDSEIHPDDKGRAKLTLFDEGVFKEDEWKKQDVLFMVQGNSSISEKGILVIARDDNGNYNIYQIGYDGWGDIFIETTKTSAPKMHLDEDSQVATSIAFKDQIFYTRGNKLYLYNIASGEEIYLYKVNGLITKLKFRCDRWYDEGYGTIDANNRLALVVKGSDGRGGIHELFLSIGGDVDKVSVYSDFDEIQDIIFSKSGMLR